MIDTRLNSLLRIAETGSFTKAADRLSLTQPAVSQHIRSLESELGIRIFERSHNEIRLTPAGEIVVKYARRMQAVSAGMLQALKDEKDKVSSLTIGITHTAESSSIAETLAAYANEKPGLSLKIMTDTISRLYSRLRCYELDFIIVDNRVDDPSVRYFMLDTDCLILAVAPGHPLARQGTVTISNLKKEKLLLRSPGSNTRRQFDAALESRNMSIDEFNVILEIDNIATIKDLIRRGLGVSVLARSACMDELRKKKIIALSIENFSMVREINIAFLKDYEHPELLREIAEKYNELNGIREK